MRVHPFEVEREAGLRADEPPRAAERNLLEISRFSALQGVKKDLVGLLVSLARDTPSTGPARCRRISRPIGPVEGSRVVCRRAP
jgi:hypothetical protein